MKEIDVYKANAIKILQRNFSHICKEKIERIVNKYVKTVIDEINKQPLNMSLNIYFTYASVDEIKRKAGRYQLNKDNNKTIYISNWFYQNLPLYAIWDKGNNLTGKVSLIKMNYNLRISVDRAYQSAINNSNNDEVTKQLKLLYGDSFEDLVKHTDKKPTVDLVPINLKSLKAYIDKTQYICDNKNKNNKLKLRIQYAKQIYTIAMLCDGDLLQVINESDFGRRYYKGPNLQSAPKEVRIASLGDCVEFDIANSVFAWRYDLAKDINPKGKYTETLDYLDRKSMWRKEIAKVVFDDIDYMPEETKIKIIKGAFTAISFGAKGRVENFTWETNGVQQTLSLNTIIKSSHKRKLFLEHPFVSAFIEEQKEISEIIFNAVKKEIKKYPQFRDKRLNRNEVLAFLYQQQERDIMEQCIAQIPKDDFLLLVHDAFYVRKLSAEKIVNIKQILLEHNSELKLGCENHKAYTPYDYEEHEHKKFIKKEMLRAKNYKKKNF